jgi:hypothetical protein
LIFFYVTGYLLTKNETIEIKNIGVINKK